MDHLNGDNVLAIVRPSNETRFWLNNTVKVRPEWKTPGLVDGCIVITLQDRPLTSAGVVFGTGTHCEVVIAAKEYAVPHEGMFLSDTFGKVHISIGLDHRYRLVARDLTGGHGFQVRYHRSIFHNIEDVCHAEWILAGPGVPDMCRGPGEIDPWRLVIVVNDEQVFDILPGKALSDLRKRGMEAQLFRQGKDPHGPLSEQVPFTVPRSKTDGGFLEKGIGEGGFGVVAHCWNPFTGQHFVMKRPLRPVNGWGLERWKQEARMMDLARHPHIVEFMGANFDNGPSITMEYLALGSLRGQVDITRTEAMLTLRQCTSALSFLHGHIPAIIHRDLKPDNILVQQRGRGGAHGDMIVKLCDFGLAREISKEKIKSRPGSRLYEPPEYYPLDGQPQDIGVKMDIWSMGVVILELLSGKRPIYTVYDPNDDGTMVGIPMHHRIVKNLHQFAEDNQGDFEVLKRMLVLNPGERISAQEAHELAERMDVSAFERAQAPLSNAAAAATEPSTAVQGEAQPLVDATELIAANELSSLSISGPRPAKRKRR